MIRPIVPFLLGQPKPEAQPGPSADKQTRAGFAPQRPASDLPEQERLPPRDDSFYLGLCLSHW